MSKLTTLAIFWREFNLPSFQARMDASATEITQKQDETSGTRSILIGLLQDFKASHGDETKMAAAPLIKAFQTGNNTSIV